MKKDIRIMKSSNGLNKKVKKLNNINISENASS